MGLQGNRSKAVARRKELQIFPPRSLGGGRSVAAVNADGHRRRGDPLDAESRPGHAQIPVPVCVVRQRRLEPAQAIVQVAAIADGRQEDGVVTRQRLRRGVLREQGRRCRIASHRPRR